MFVLGCIGVALTAFHTMLGLIAFVCAGHQAHRAISLDSGDPRIGSHGFGAFAWATGAALLWTVALLIVRFV